MNFFVVDDVRLLLGGAGAAMDDTRPPALLLLLLKYLQHPNVPHSMMTEHGAITAAAAADCDSALFDCSLPKLGLCFTCKVILPEPGSDYCSRDYRRRVEQRWSLSMKMFEGSYGDCCLIHDQFNSTLPVNL
jgi:hypothetical protein